MKSLFRAAAYVSLPPAAISLLAFIVSYSRATIAAHAQYWRRHRIIFELWFIWQHMTTYEFPGWVQDDRSYEFHHFDE